MASLDAAFDPPGRSWHGAHLRAVLIAAYLLIYVGWFLAFGVIIDRISVLISLALFFVVSSVGRPPTEWRRMTGDLALIVAMWLAYDESRGFADRVGFPLQVESVRNLDRWLFFGTDPVVWLQGRFLDEPGTVRWYDVAASALYFSHFIVVPVAIAALWFTSRALWVRFMRRFATVLFVACAMFVVLPTAPPWMAAGGKNSLGLELDALPALRRPTGVGWRHIGLDGFVNQWDHGRDWANQIAAMPSLHASFAMFVVVFFAPMITDRRVRLALFAYPTAMAVALVYFAEHYVVDSLAGWLVVAASFAIWRRIEGRRPSGRTSDHVEPTKETADA